MGKPGPKRVLKNVVIKGIYQQIVSFLASLTLARSIGCSNPKCRGFVTSAKPKHARQREIRQAEREARGEAKVDHKGWLRLEGRHFGSCRGGGGQRALGDALLFGFCADGGGFGGLKEV